MPSNELLHTFVKSKQPVHPMLNNVVFEGEGCTYTAQYPEWEAKLLLWRLLTPLHTTLELVVLSGRKEFCQASPKTTTGEGCGTMLGAAPLIGLQEKV